MKKALIFLMVMAGAAQAMKSQAGDKELVGKKRDHQEAQEGESAQEERESQTRKRDQKRERKSNAQEEHSSLDEASEGQQAQAPMGVLNPIDQRAGVSQEVQHDMMENNTVRGAPDLGPGGRSLGDKTDEERALQEAMAMNEALVREDARREAEEAEKNRREDHTQRQEDEVVYENLVMKEARREEEEQKRGEDHRQAQGVEIIDTSSVPSSSAQMSEQEKQAKRAEFVKRAPIGSNEGIMKEIFQFLPFEKAALSPLNKYHVEKGINSPMEYQQHLKFTNNFNQAKLDEVFHTIQERAGGMNPVVSLDLSTARLNGRPIVLDNLVAYVQDLPPTLKTIHIGNDLTVDRPLDLYSTLLPRMTGLQTLTIRNQVTPQEMQELASALAQMPNLNELTFRFDNNLNRAELDTIFQTIQELGRVTAQRGMNPVVSLDLSAARLNGRPIVLDNLVAYAQSLPQMLRAIHIGNDINLDRPVGSYLPLLSRMSHLRNLLIRFNFNPINSQEMQALASALAQMPNLSVLALESIRMSDAGMQALAPALAQKPNLNRLFLSSNQIGDAGMQALAPALAQMPNLNILDLDSNQIGDAGMQALAPVLPQMPNLIRLSLLDNQIGDAGSTALASVLPQMHNLRNLDLSNNRMGDAGMQALANVLPQMPNFQELSLSSNQIGDVGATVLAPVLPQMQSLRNVGLARNRIGVDGTWNLAFALDRTPIPIRMGLRDNPVDRESARQIQGYLRGSNSGIWF